MVRLSVGERVMLEFDLFEDESSEKKDNEEAQIKLPLLTKVQSILRMIGVGRSDDVADVDRVDERDDNSKEIWCRTFQYVDPWNRSHDLQFRYLKHKLATRVQSNVRGMLVRRNMVRHLESGVTALQAAFRGYSVRVRLFRNVCRIQAVWRGVSSMCFVSHTQRKIHVFYITNRYEREIV